MTSKKEFPVKSSPLLKHVLDLSGPLTIHLLSNEQITSSVESYYRHVDNKFTYTFSLKALTYQDRYCALELTVCEDREKNPADACLLRLHFYSTSGSGFTPGQIYRGLLQGNTLSLTERLIEERAQALASPFEGESKFKTMPEAK